MYVCIIIIRKYVVVEENYLMELPRELLGSSSDYSFISAIWFFFNLSPRVEVTRIIYFVVVADFLQQNKFEIEAFFYFSFRFK